MTSRQQNSLAMAKVAIGILDKHASVWQQNKRVKKAVEDAKAVLAEIESRNEGGLAQSQGVTSQKDDTVNRAATLAAKISQRVKVYATDDHNLDLKQKMSFSKSDYLNMSDAALTAQLQNLANAVTPILDKLGDYGVSEQMLTELAALATEFKSLETAPRNLIAERKMHNSSIPDLLKMLKADLAVIDGLIGIFEDEELESAYKNARIIIDRGTRQAGDAPQTPK